MVEQDNVSCAHDESVQVVCGQNKECADCTMTIIAGNCWCRRTSFVFSVVRTYVRTCVFSEIRNKISETQEHECKMTVNRGVPSKSGHAQI